jgi:tryptophan synthase alpha chain
MRAITDLPLALGFGISTPEQVAEAAAIADGIVVGSAIVHCIERYGKAPDLCARLEEFTRRLTAPLRQS